MYYVPMTIILNIALKNNVLTKYSTMKFVCQAINWRFQSLLLINIYDSIKYETLKIHSIHICYKSTSDKLLDLK